MNFARGGFFDTIGLFPDMKYLKRELIERNPWSFAPDGRFEFKLALNKAINVAERYIYVEDQGFFSQDIMKWIRDRLDNPLAPFLKVILVHRADPADHGEETPGQCTSATNIAINNYLANIKPTPTFKFEDRIAFYERTDNVVIHSKTWIIDDKYTIIGSANSYRRSLYMDGELSIAVYNSEFAKRYRMALWAEHCGIYDPSNFAPFSDINYILPIWKNSWAMRRGPLPSVKLDISKFQYKEIPFKAGPEKWQWPGKEIDMGSLASNALSYFKDGDSRKKY